jgi:hypothetical protein
MSICNQCGEHIEFRYVDGRCTPIHAGGGWCRGSRSSGASNARTTGLSSGDRFRGERSAFNADDICRPTTCPKCGAEVFFIRHNGGSVWLDDLGWPWPKHACLRSDVAGSDVLAPAALDKQLRGMLVGVVIRSLIDPPDVHGNTLIAVRGSNNLVACLSLLGRLSNIVDTVVLFKLGPRGQVEEIRRPNGDRLVIAQAMISAGQLGLSTPRPKPAIKQKPPGVARPQTFCPHCKVPVRVDRLARHLKRCPRRIGKL